MYASKIVTHFRCIFSESESSKFFQRISLGISANNSIPLRIRSHCQGCLLLQLKSSVTVVSSALGTCTLFSWTLTGSIIITEQSQPRNHHNSYFAWMLSLPASHIRWTFKDENTFSSHQSYPYRSWRICGTAQCVTVPHVL